MVIKLFGFKPRNVVVSDMVCQNVHSKQGRIVTGEDLEREQTKAFLTTAPKTFEVYKIDE